ncbi:MAG: hypothetical protein ACYC1C_15495, partial [Chloroflexota bacterium]
MTQLASNPAVPTRRKPRLREKLLFKALALTFQIANRLPDQSIAAALAVFERLTTNPTYKFHAA